MKRPTLSVTPFDEWVSQFPEREEIEGDCPCCDGDCEIELEDDFGNCYDVTCAECDGYGKTTQIEEALTKKDWIAAVRKDARRFRKFSGVSAKLKLAGGSHE